MKIVIYGKPQGKARPRFTRTGCAYTPKATKDYESLVAAAAKLSLMNEQPPEPPLECLIIAYFEPPASTSKKKRDELIGQYYTGKPDIDNIIKIIMDGLNGIAYTDDKQVTAIQAVKLYGVKSRVEVEVRHIDQKAEIQKSKSVFMGL